MTPLRLFCSAGLALVLASTTVPSAAAPEPSPTASAEAEAPDVEPAAVQALERMSAYLRTLTAFEVKAQTSQDLVTFDGQKVKLDGWNRYLIRRPDAFVVDVATSWKVRKLTYDGKQLTLAAPDLGYYATVAAPATISETMAAANRQHGLEVPLQDLFRWTDPTSSDNVPLTTATVIGRALVDGVETDHYAFREGEVDWQIWIQRGERPLPLKIVIIDRRDDALPQYEAKLAWNLSPQMTSDTFAFRPATGAKPIRLATMQPE